LQSGEGLSSDAGNEGRGRSSNFTGEQLQTIINNTIAVITKVTDKQAEWRGTLTTLLKLAQAGNQTQDTEFFMALLTILDGKNPTLSPKSPYATALGAIQTGIAEGGTGLEKGRKWAEDETEKRMTAIQAYLEADDLPSMQQAIETHRETLFRKEVTALFQENIKDAREAGEEHIAEQLEFYLRLLKACQTDGIAAVFARMK
jgi:hypothetical protein